MSLTAIFLKYCQPCLAEFIGTWLFVFIGCLASITGGTVIVQVAAAHGLAIMVFVTAFGNISGGHFNPAVTFGVVLSGAIGPVLAVLYVVSQLLGAIMAALCVKGIVASDVYLATNGGATVPSDIISEGSGQWLGTEILLTFTLVTVVLFTAVNGKTKSQFAPAAIGISIFACICAGASISGASMNPARSFGPAVVSNVWTYHWIYWIGPLLGACLSALTLRFGLGDSDSRLVLKDEVYGEENRLINEP